MSDMGNFWQVNDYVNAKSSWLASASKDHRQVNLYKFLEYQNEGNQNSASETIRVPVYSFRLEHIFVSMVKVFDTVKGGYFTTGDLQVYSDFALQGYSAAYTNPENGIVIPEYAGDLIEWNGKMWAVADVLEPIQWGFLAKQVFYSTVMRKTNRTNIGIKPGP